MTPIEWLFCRHYDYALLVGNAWAPPPQAWFDVVNLGGCTLFQFWPYIVLPLDFILGITLVSYVFKSIKDVANATDTND
jgi:hypothetical protein